VGKTRLVMELGTGVDLHGGDCTKAAKRAVEDAIRHSSLLFVADTMSKGIRPKMYVDVTIAAPNPNTVNGSVVLEALPFGEKTIQVVNGGMEVARAEPNMIIMCNAAVLVTIET